MSADASIITLTTDFGTEDAYVPAMKGTMLSIAPEARLVDVTHEIAPQDVMESAFVLQSAQPYFPEGTIHLVVVDPGVGTERRAVAIREAGHWYVGPDNGLFPLVIEQEPDAVVELDNPEMWRTSSPSSTFHGRDIFAPAAAHLAAGRSLEELGSPVTSLEPLRWAEPFIESDSIEGWITHVDHFGNCITNVRRSTLLDMLELDEEASLDESSLSLEVYAGNTVLDSIHSTYGDVSGEDPLLLFGSTGFLEVAVNGGNAAELLDIRKGDSIKIALSQST